MHGFLLRLVSVALLLRWSHSLEIPCVDTVTGNVVDGIGVEFGKCLPAANSFFTSLEPSPSSSNGLQAGAPVDVVLRLSQPGRNATSGSTQSQPTFPGLPFPKGGRIVLDFSKEFIYNFRAPKRTDTNTWVELGLVDGNKLFGGEDCFERRAASNIVCANWTSTFGENNNQIVITSLGEEGLSGERANQLGIKVRIKTEQTCGQKFLAHSPCSTFRSDQLLESWTKLLFFTVCPPKHV